MRDVDQWYSMQFDCSKGNLHEEQTSECEPRMTCRLYNSTRFKSFLVLIYYSYSHAKSLDICHRLTPVLYYQACMHDQLITHSNTFKEQKQIFGQMQLILKYFCLLQVLKGNEGKNKIILLAAEQNGKSFYIYIQ